MMRKWSVVLVLVCAALLTGMPVLAQRDDEFIFGMVLVGPLADQGWSQAHYEAGLYVEEHVPGTKMLVFEDLNEAATDLTLFDVVSDMVDEGAQMIFTTSDAFEDGTDELARDPAFSEIVFINVSGDNVLTGTSPKNVGNLMGQAEWAKLIAGCAAGIATHTGSIGYLGGPINPETRRFAASAFLGARYCYEHYAGGRRDDLTFTVTWIGFWVNIPGVTLDPAVEVNAFYDSGADVVISGIDTTEAITIAGSRAARGEEVYAVPFNYLLACDIAPKACLGVPYFNWGPSYVELVRAVIDGEWKPGWDWASPDWSNINNLDTSPIGFTLGDGLTAGQRRQLRDFIRDLAAYATNPFTPTNEFGIKSMALWSGPLLLQDGTELVGPGQVLDPLSVWYLPQLLQGMVGRSE